MKLQSLILVLSTLPVLSFGQVTLTNVEDFTVGTILKFQPCDTAGVKPGLTGPKQTWDFSTLSSARGTLTETMVKPDKTPNASQFPSANIVEKYSDGKFVYIDKEDKQSNMVGFSGNNVVIAYPKPIVIAKRPVSFGGTNSYPYTTKYSVGTANFEGTGMCTIAADGYGTLILPNKKYSNVLRIKITQKQKDVQTQSKAAVNTTTTTYVWFDEKHKSALLKISVTTSPSYSNRTVEYLISEEDK